MTRLDISGSEIAKDLSPALSPPGGGCIREQTGSWDCRKNLWLVQPARECTTTSTDY